MKTATKPERLERSKCATPSCRNSTTSIYCVRCQRRQQQAGQPEGK